MNRGSNAGLGSCGMLCALLALLSALPGYAAGLPHYQIQLEVDFARGTFAGEVVVAYANPSAEPISEAFFRLYANARSFYGSAFVAVQEARVDGELAGTRLVAEDTVLAVGLSRSLAPGESAEIALRFSGAAATSVGGSYLSGTEYGLLLKAEHGITFTTFYPVIAPFTSRGWAVDPVAAVGDAIFAETAAYDVALRVASGVRVIPSPDASTAGPDGTTMHVFHRDALRDFSLVLLEQPRTPVEATTRDVSVRSWFAPQHADAAAVALGVGSAAVDIYTGLFGALPFASVDIVEVPLQRVAGVELSGLFLVSAEYANAPDDVFFTVIVSHEMAHQWFSAAVGSDPLWEPWLDEALATYASYLALAALDPQVAEVQLSGWAASYNAARRDWPDLQVTHPSSRFSSSATYSAFAYAGGATHLAALRHALGDEFFFRGLADYYGQQSLAIATGADLAQAFRGACGCEPGGALFSAEAAAGP